MKKTTACEPGTKNLTPDILFTSVKKDKTWLQKFMGKFRSKENAIVNNEQITDITKIDNKSTENINKQPIVKYRKLNGRELIKKMIELSYWSGILLKRPYLKREFIFENYQDALKFLNLVAKKATEINHYPKITIVRNKVFIMLRTNEVDGITTFDIELAKYIDIIGT
jgi:4a-hydroxytetrahydrobiopterin dehydratase